MMDSIWMLLGIVMIAGGIGGILNALMTDNGFILPRAAPNPAGGAIYRPGWLGNVLTGAVAAAISWGLYGPLSAHVIATTVETAAGGSDASAGLTLGSLMGAVLIGIGGARWLTGEVDKKLLKATATAVAGREPSTDTASLISFATPAQALEAARQQ